MHASDPMPAIATPAMPDQPAPEPSLPVRLQPKLAPVVPPLEAPAAPVRAREVRAPEIRTPEIAAAPPAAKPPATVAQARPEPSRSTASTARRLDAGRDFSVREAREDYLRELVRTLSRSRIAQDSPEAVAGGLVVARLTVARDGRLVGESLVKSSGSAELDRGVMTAIRRAAPFAPLPADLAQDRYTFVVPINYVRDR
jgi:protein TonB